MRGFFCLNYLTVLNYSLKNIKRKHLLPSIAAAAVLRLEETLALLIEEAKRRKIPRVKIYEVLLQNYLFAGYPSALVALKILKHRFPKTSSQKKDDMNLYHFKKRGIENCKAIYGSRYEKLISNVSGFSPELSDWLVLEGYGKVLGRKELSLKERELCIVAVLCVQKFEEQLYSHVNGAYRLGVKIEEINELIETLALLGRKGNVNFGKKVLQKFRKNKGVNK